MRKKYVIPVVSTTQQSNIARGMYIVGIASYIEREFSKA